MSPFYFYILVTISMVFPLLAKDFGIRGTLFPIEEESMLFFLQRNLSEKSIFQKASELQKTVRENARNPKPLQDIKYAKKAKKFLFDPSIRNEHDILDLEGRILAKKGTVINPLLQLKLSSGLLLLDGSLSSHVEWAKNQQGSFKWILIKGKPIDLEETENRPIFFDQTGISAHFQVENYPARITQKGDRLLVEEIPVDDVGNPL